MSNNTTYQTLYENPMIPMKPYEKWEKTYLSLNWLQ